MATPKQDEESGELVVFSLIKEAICSECGEELGKGSLMKLENEKPLCMHCADFGELVFLPSGNTALTRRARKHSTLSAIVLRFSRARKRYERQGILVEDQALEQAEIECAGDEGERQKAREKAAASRAILDRKFLAEFTENVRSLFPGCPADEAALIAEHACQKYSGRVGRSAAAKRFDEEAVKLAVRAHIRHVHTPYDSLLSKMVDRHDARARVLSEVDAVAERWRRKG